MTTLYTQQSSNIRKTWLLVTVSLVLVVLIGWLFSLYFNSAIILYIAIALGLGTNLIAYWQSDKIALAVSGAKPISREQNVELYRIIENLCITAGLPMPRVYIMSTQQINAFATGRDPKHAAVAVTQGALDKLNKDELEGVLAHELSHVGNRDILVSTIVVVIAGITATLAEWFLRISFFGGGRRGGRDNEGGGLLAIIAVVAVILAPLAAMLIQLAVSRKREYLADASGALLTRYPEGLASALEKIERDTSAMPMAKTATAHLFITNPFKGDQKRVSWFTRLFATHPPIEDRIRILRGMDVSQ